MRVRAARGLLGIAWQVHGREGGDWTFRRHCAGRGPVSIKWRAWHTHHNSRCYWKRSLCVLGGGGEGLLR